MTVQVDLWFEDSSTNSVQTSSLNTIVVEEYKTQNHNVIDKTDLQTPIEQSVLQKFITKSFQNVSFFDEIL